MMIAFAICFSASIGGGAKPAVLEFRPSVNIVDRSVRLADLADLRVLPKVLRARAEGLVVFRLPSVDRDHLIGADVLIARVRSLMPALAPWLNASAKTEIRVSYAAPFSEPRKSYTQNSGLIPIAVRTGDRLVAKFDVGVVTVQRTVVALQPARAGTAVFARSSEGGIVSLRLPGNSQ
jgi:hypothetical protein